MTEFGTVHSAKPCLGCGYCCSKAPCVLGEGIPCKELVHKDGRYWCGLVLNASEEERELFEIDLGIGEGCCSSLFNTEREKMLMKVLRREENAIQEDDQDSVQETDHGRF